MSKHTDTIRAAAAMCRNGPMPDNLFDETLQEKLSAAADALEIAERQLRMFKRTLEYGTENGLSGRECHNAMVAYRAGRKIARRVGAPKPGAGKRGRG